MSFILDSSVHRRRDLRVVIGAKAISFFGDQLAAFALVLRLQSHGASASSVAGLLVADLAPIMLLSGVAGRVVDRIDNRRLLTVSGLAQLVVCAVLVTVTTPAAVLALVALLGAGQAFNAACWQALLPTLADPDRLPRVISHSQAATTVAGIAAPALSGLLVGTVGAGSALVIDCATFGLVALAGLLLRTRRTTVARVAGERLRGGFAIVRADPVLRTTITLLGVSIVLGAMVNVVEVFLVRTTLGASAVWYGVSGACNAVGLLAGSLWAGRLRDRPAQGRALVVFGALLGVGLAGMGLAPAIGWLVAIGCVTGSFNGVLNVAMNSLILGSARPDERGRVGALVGGVTSATMLGAYVIGGALAAILGPRQIFVLGGALCILSPLLVGPRLLRAVAVRPAPMIDEAVAAPNCGDGARRHAAR